MKPEPLPDSFIKEVQFALQNLYDPVALRNSPLIQWLNIQSAGSPGIALQEGITDAIRSLKPDTEIPLQSNAWRFYHVLIYRYVEQTTQRIVAASMSLSVRQLRRLEREAEISLADFLWNKHQPESSLIPQNASENSTLLAPADEQTPDTIRELEWLKESFPTEFAGIGELIRANLKMLSPILSTNHIQLHCEIPDSLPPITGQLTTTRQALMNLFMAAANCARNGRMDIVASRLQNQIQVLVTAVPQDTEGVVDSDSVAEQLKSCQQFVHLFDGEMQSLDLGNGEALSVRLCLPAAEQVPVLVIDDNADTLRLIERYFSGTIYQFIGTHDPEEAIELIKQHQPRVILLDVMMPGIADWEFLGRLRANPSSRGIPVVICTILPQEQLALSLGAAGFIRKPVNRGQLLAILSQQLPSGSPGSPG